MSIVLAIAAAFVAAICFGLASAWQHLAAEKAPPIAGSLRERVVALLTIVRHPKWIAAGGFDAMGFVLQVVAVTHGPIAVVQPLLVAELLSALIFSASFERRRLTLNEWCWGILLVVSLTAFLVIASPAKGHSDITTSNAIIAGVVAIALTAGSALLVGINRSRAALIWGTLTGALYGYAAALMKLTGDELSHGVVRVLTTWPLYALIVIGGGGFFINQLAFQAGRLSTSFAAITAVDPVVSVALGITLFGEGITNSPIHIVGECVSLLVLIVATLRLSKSTAAVAESALH
jgi:drug/metabolite transporter (DMT)-like permease